MDPTMPRPPRPQQPQQQFAQQGAWNPLWGNTPQPQSPYNVQRQQRPPQTGMQRLGAAVAPPVEAPMPAPVEQSVPTPAPAPTLSAEVGTDSIGQIASQGLAAPAAAPVIATPAPAPMVDPVAAQQRKHALRNAMMRNRMLGLG